MQSFLAMLGDSTSRLWATIRPMVYAIIVVVINALESENGIELWIPRHTEKDAQGVEVVVPAHLGLDAKVILGIILGGFGLRKSENKSTKAFGLVRKKK